MAKGFKHGAGGGANLNFKVVGGTSEPSNSKANTIWVNTDKEITSWHFGAEEPNVYELQNEIRTDNGQVDPRSHFAPHKLTEGNIINFVVPYTSTESMEWLAIVDTYDNSQRYCIRNADHTLLTTWEKGAKVSVKISNDETAFDVHKFRTAYIVSYGSYYHEEGTVWISTGTSSTAPFNALKKNGITVYPLSAKQYVSGAWVNKTAQIYQNGVWGELDTSTFVKNGDLIRNLNASARTGSNFAVTQHSGYVGVKNNIATSTAATHDELVDVTNYTKLTLYADVISVYVAGGGNPRVGPVLLKALNAGSYSAMNSNIVAGSYTKNKGVQTLVCDISSFSGEYYVGILLDGGDEGYPELKVYDFNLS